ncbi:callose synthase 3-like isoform X3 [Carica papaya]|uniref:callose synthase 3-like isoform X3 n=1 Tax=Carica papaya TaxID=3649 RepID=UPI000B8CD5B1|nr:callose synthase 3-like isoform X3 [Carica papaya]
MLSSIRGSNQLSGASNQQNLEMDDVGYTEESFDCEIVPPSLVELVPILRVVNEVEKSSPKIAHLCRFYAFEEAQKLDSTKRGDLRFPVHQFKDALQQCLEKGRNPALVGRVKKGDIREMRSFYQHQYKKYIKVFQMAADKDDWLVIS